MKKISISYLLVFVFGFMLFFYEPLVMYMANIHDITFDLFLIIKPVFLTFLAFLGIGFLFFTILSFLNQKFFSKIPLYEIFILILLFFFFGFYLQGNFLTVGLPRLDGTDIIWNDYILENIISVVMWILVLGVILFLSKKYGIQKVVSKVPFACFFVLFIFVASLVGQIFLADGVFQKKTPAVALTTNYDLASTDENFIILLLDSVDSVMFEHVMKQKGYESVFEDFTYYKDTTSTYVYTRDSVPYILSGVWNHNKKEFNKYCTEAMDKSYLLSLLQEKNYNINLFSNDIIWDSDEYSKVSNMVRFDRRLDSQKYLKEQKRFILFKYLPFPLKRFSSIEELDFNRGRLASDEEFYEWGDILAYNHLHTSSITKTDEKVFKFIHLEGAHVPFDLNNQLIYVGWGNGTYDDKLESSILVIDTFLKVLKENDVYDNSHIIIMSDHGYALGNKKEGRQNPIFFVKTANEHHELETSSLPLSYTDLNELYTDLLDGKTKEELFSNVKSKRERTVIVYEYQKENHMVEYKQTGKAWNEKTMIPTGKEYNR